MLTELGDLVHDVAIAGPDRDYVTALIFPNMDACRSICAAGTRERTAVDVLGDEAVRSRVRGILGRLACEASAFDLGRARCSWTSAVHRRARDDREGSINQKPRESRGARRRL
jgi:feruloyl-CoA synthase